MGHVQRKMAKGAGSVLSKKEKRKSFMFLISFSQDECTLQYENDLRFNIPKVLHLRHEHRPIYSRTITDITMMASLLASRINLTKLLCNCSVLDIRQRQTLRSSAHVSSLLYYLVSMASGASIQLPVTTVCIKMFPMRLSGYEKLTRVPKILRQS